jgi:hypothetical protein
MTPTAVTRVPSSLRSPQSPNPLSSTIPFTSLPCAHDLGGENPYVDTKDVLKLLNCGRLGRWAAGHPWSALRVVRSCRKTAQRPRYCSKPKQQLCIQNGTRAHYLNYLQRGRVRRGKKRRKSDWLANQMDRKVIDRQIDRNKADERWYPSRPCSVLNSGL